jgi:hypothetical protein
MYMRTEIVNRIHQEKLEQAVEQRNASRVKTLYRTQRRMARAERQMSRAWVEATRLRQELEAEF